MKFLFTILCSVISSAAFAAPGLKGINYDPVHSPDYEIARQKNDKQGMIAAINRDFLKLFAIQTQYRYPQVVHLKTFFSSFASSGSGRQVFINIADVVYAWNTTHPNNKIKLALGVYQFRPQVDACADEVTCVRWTQSQINSAVASANAYPSMIDRIIVGNENIQDGAPDVVNIRKRLVQDIATIKSQITNKAIKVGTAQISPVVLDMFRTTKYNAIKNAADFIGTNVYPYWGGAPYSSAKSIVINYWNTINQIRGTKEVIATEEGWPTSGPSNGQGIPSPVSAHDYFKWWYTRSSVYGPMSYYFALFDKLPGSAEKQKWGVFSADRSKTFLNGA